MAKKMSTKKKASAAVAGVLAVALAVGGAYAWTNYSQTATNTFSGTSNAAVLLHDDFDGENKDVYVENTGESDVYVRVKFAEYLQIGNTVEFPAYGTDTTDTENIVKVDPDDVTTWSIHQFFDDATDDNLCTLSSHTYFKWEMTGAKKGYLAGVTEADGRGFGGLDSLDGLSVGGEVTVGDITTTYQETAEASPIMMLKDYLPLWEVVKAGLTGLTPEQETLWDSVKYGCWLLDTDGWAYWSVALAPDTATNLLLDAVVPDNKSPADNWVYHIDVQLQAATFNDLDSWARNGIADVANPDNSIATATGTAYDFLVAINPDAFNTTNGTVMGRDGAYYIGKGDGVYAVAELNDTETGYVETAELVLAGHDGKLGTEDDNMLNGRSAEWGGEIKVDEIFLADETNPESYYTFADAAGDYKVLSGIDKKLGTHDDVITSADGILGKYEINGDATETENVGWVYAGGPVDNMLVVTEYILDGTTFGTTNEYKDSLVATKATDIGNSMGINSAILKPDVTISMKDSSVKYCHICNNTEHDFEKGIHTGTSCVFHPYSAYYNANPPQDDITTTFFVLSMDEIVAAFGDGDGGAVDIQTYRRIQIAPAYEKTVGTITEYKDGNGNPYTTAYWWTRDPGYMTKYATAMSAYGNFNTQYDLTSQKAGVRPACYMDLSVAPSAS